MDRRLAVALAMLLWIGVAVAIGVYLRYVLLPKDSWDSISSIFLAFISITASPDILQALAGVVKGQKEEVRNRPVLVAAAACILCLLFIRLALDGPIRPQIVYGYLLLDLLVYLAVLFFRYLR